MNIIRFYSAVSLILLLCACGGGGSGIGDSAVAAHSQTSSSLASFESSDSIATSSQTSSIQSSISQISSSVSSLEYIMSSQSSNAQSSVSTTPQTTRIFFFETGDGEDYQGAGSGANAAAKDNDGNIYITGGYFDSDAFKYNFIIIKVAPDGSEIWRNIYGNDNKDFVAEDIAISTNGVIEVVGVATVNYSTSDERDVMQMSINADGTKESDAITSSSIWDYATSIALDSQGNSCIASTTYFPEDKGYNGSWQHHMLMNNNYFWAYDTAGVVSGSKPIVYIDAQDNVYMSGDLADGGSYIAKNSPSGTFQWQHDFTGNSLRLASFQSTLYAAGTNADALSIYKIATSGQVVSTFNVDLGENEQLEQFNLDIQGNFYIAGQMEQNGQRYLFVSKLDTEGNLIWIQHYAVTYTSVTGLFVDADTVYVVGTLYDSNPSFSGYEGISSGQGNIYLMQIAQ